MCSHDSELSDSEVATALKLKMEPGNGLFSKKMSFTCNDTNTNENYEVNTIPKAYNLNKTCTRNS